LGWVFLKWLTLVNTDKLSDEIIKELGSRIRLENSPSRAVEIPHIAAFRPP